MLAIEALADAIMHYEGWMLGSHSYRNRNPGNLRDSPYKIGEDPAGFAVFPDLSTGYHALVHLLSCYVSGQNRHGLNQESTLAALFNVYAPTTDRNEPETYAIFVAHWLSLALHRTYSANTKLKDIVEVPAPELPIPDADHVQ